MSNFFDNLKLDSWYKLLLYMGGILFVLSVTVESKGISNRELMLFSLSLFAIGIGEFKSRKIIFEQKSPNAYTGLGGLYQYPTRKPDLISILLDLAGIILLAIFLFSILR